MAVRMDNLWINNQEVQSTADTWSTHHWSSLASVRRTVPHSKKKLWVSKKMLTKQTPRPRPVQDCWRRSNNPTFPDLLSLFRFLRRINFRRTQSNVSNLKSQTFYFYTRHFLESLRPPGVPENDLSCETQPNPLRYKGHPLEWFLYPENLIGTFPDISCGTICLRQGGFPLNPHTFKLHPEHRSLVESSVGKPAHKEERIFLSGTQKTPCQKGLWKCDLNKLTTLHGPRLRGMFVFPSLYCLTGWWLLAIV